MSCTYGSKKCVAKILKEKETLRQNPNFTIIDDVYKHLKTVKNFPKHSNIITCYGICLKNISNMIWVCYIMEQGETTLKNLFNKKNDDRKKTIIAIDFAQQYLSAVLHLQRMNLSNFDLKPQNSVLVIEDSQLCIKLIDHDDTSMEHMFLKDKDNQCKKIWSISEKWLHPYIYATHVMNERIDNSSTNCLHDYMSNITWNPFQWDNWSAILIIFFILEGEINIQEEFIDNKIDEFDAERNPNPPQLGEYWTQSIYDGAKNIITELSEILELNKNEENNPLQQFCEIHLKPPKEKKKYWLEEIIMEKPNILVDMEIALNCVMEHCKEQILPNNFGSLEKLKKEYCQNYINILNK